jgi:hypothetical protein
MKGLQKSGQEGAINEGGGEMKKLFFLISIAVLTVFLVSGAVLAQPSAKSTVAASSTNLLGTTPGVYETILDGTIHTSEQKDLNIGVFLECGLVTRTRVKSKGGNVDTSAAEAKVMVKVVIDKDTDNEREAYPGEVTYCRRAQQLEAKFQGIFEGPAECVTQDPLTGEDIIDTACLAENCLAISDTGTIVIDESCLTEEELELILDTLNANGFNFILDDLGAGDHSISVEAMVDTCTGTLSKNDDGTYSCVGGDVDADAKAFVGKGSMTVEEVRFIKGQDIMQ